MLRVARCALGLVLFAAPVARAMPPTPLSARPDGPGHTEVAGLAGFPFLELSASRGLLDFLDVGVVARSAWGNMQRLGFDAKFALAPGDDAALALTVSGDGWFAPASGAWLANTGDEDYGGAVDLLYSWTTERQRVLTFDAGWRLVATKHPPTEPLSGAVPTMAFGSNLTMLLDAEVPFARGLALVFQAGFLVHLTGLDAAVVSPVVSAGLGAAL